MNLESIIFCSSIFIAGILLFFGLRKSMPARRAAFIICLRWLWLVPVLMCFNPKILSKSSKDLENPMPVKMLIDDSASVHLNHEHWKFVQRVRDTLADICLIENCKPSIELLSKLDSRTAANLTPLSAVLPGWLADNSQERKIILTDGGDFLPEEDAWVETIEPEKQIKNSTLFIAPSRLDFFNVWIETFTAPVIAFEQKPIRINFELRRTGNITRELGTQIQISLDNQIIISKAIFFKAGASNEKGQIELPGTTRGKKILTAFVMPAENEKVIADNILRQPIDVQRNTIGVLHILGSPSWGGRFLRRFLKSEPKFDLISFFILRDPWDIDVGNERDLSLIPFPTEKLFGEELKNFNLVIIQNFSMFQFLTEEHQKNLIEFVRAGGGLIFIGGPRALSEMDLRSSPLKLIFPYDFKAKDTGNGISNLDNLGNHFESNGSFAANSKFNFEMAPIDKNIPVSLALADELLPLANQLGNFVNFEGYHEFSAQKSHNIESQVLFNAVRPDGSKVPLVVNSFPGKGRATWILTDQLWKLTQSFNSDTKSFDKNLYNDFFSAIIHWTLRTESQAALKLHHLNFSPLDDQKLSWNVHLTGSLVSYLDPDDLDLSVCGIRLLKKAFTLKRIDSNEAELTGKIVLPMNLKQNVCSVQLQHSSLKNGDWNLELQKNLPKVYTDDQIGDNPKFFRLLTARLNARVIDSSSDLVRELKSFVHTEKSSAEQSNDSATITKTVTDYYWFLRTPYFFLFLLALPLEVIVRKYRDLF